LHLATLFRVFGTDKSRCHVEHATGQDFWLDKLQIKEESSPVE
jgi:hypothetical protein